MLQLNVRAVKFFFDTVSAGSINESSRAKIKEFLDAKFPENSAYLEDNITECLSLDELKSLLSKMENAKREISLFSHDENQNLLREIKKIELEFSRAVKRLKPQGEANGIREPFFLMFNRGVSEGAGHKRPFMDDEDDQPSNGNLRPKPRS